MLTGTKVTKATAHVERRRPRGADADGKTQKIVGRDPARGDRPRSGHDRARRGRSSASRWSAATSRSTSSIAPRCPAVSAIGDVITLGTGVHPQLAHVSSMEGVIVGGADRGEGSAAAQLRPRARLHLLRSGDRQRRPDRGRGQGARLRRARSARSRSACSAAPRWPAKPRGS